MKHGKIKLFSLDANYVSNNKLKKKNKQLARKKKQSEIFFKVSNSFLIISEVLSADEFFFLIL